MNSPSRRAFSQGRSRYAPRCFLATPPGSVCLLLQRFKRPVPMRFAAVYLVAMWLAAGASMLIWQLTAIPFAAIAWHTGGLAFLVAAWRDGTASTEAGRRLFKSRR